MKSNISLGPTPERPNAQKLFHEVLAVIPEHVDARRNLAKTYLETPAHRGDAERAEGIFL
jgi:hypothetical protein